MTKGPSRVEKALFYVLKSGRTAALSEVQGVECYLFFSICCAASTKNM